MLARIEGKQEQTLHMLCHAIFVSEESDLKKDIELVPNKLRMLRVRLCTEGPKGEAEALLACVLGKYEVEDTDTG